MYNKSARLARDVVSTTLQVEDGLQDRNKHMQTYVAGGKNQDPRLLTSLKMFQRFTAIFERNIGNTYVIRKIDIYLVSASSIS